MHSRLHILVVSPNNPAAAPEPGPILDVEAKSEDALLEAAHSLIAARGEHLHALCFGTKGLIAYVDTSQ